MTVLAVFALITAGYLAFCFARARPGDFAPAPGDLVVCAAHSDDCAIMAGEMAPPLLAAGHRIQIVYLTCSGSGMDDPEARIREAEARACWAHAGLAEGDLHFLNLPQSPVNGPRSYDDATLGTVRTRLAEIFAALPEGAMVLMPAAHESHIDHRAMRDAARAALESTRPGALRAYEVAEYNPLLSMLQVPGRVLNRMARTLPGLNRMLTHFHGAAGFAAGDAGAVFRGDPGRLAFKHALFDFFASQDPALLRVHFGAPVRYRGLSADGAGWRFAWLEGQADWSVAVMAALMLGLAFGFGLALPGGWAWAAVLTAGAALAGLRRKKVLAALCLAMLAGLASNAAAQPLPPTMEERIS